MTVDIEAEHIALKQKVHEYQQTTDRYYAIYPLARRKVEAFADAFLIDGDFPDSVHKHARTVKKNLVSVNSRSDEILSALGRISVLSSTRLQALQVSELGDMIAQLKPTDNRSTLVATAHWRARSYHLAVAEGILRSHLEMLKAYTSDGPDLINSTGLILQELLEFGAKTVAQLAGVAAVKNAVELVRRTQEILEKAHHLPTPNGQGPESNLLAIEDQFTVQLEALDSCLCALHEDEVLN